MSIGPEPTRRPLVFLEGQVKTPPFTDAGRIEAGTRLREIQEGVSLGLPTSRPMPSIGTRVHELRIRDGGHNWRIVYRTDSTMILVVAVFAKTTQQTPRQMIARCRKRLKDFDA